MTPEAQKRTILEASEVPALVRLRERVGLKLGATLVGVGQLLHASGHMFGPGRLDGSSERGNGDDETVAVGVLLQVGGEPPPGDSARIRRVRGGHGLASGR